MSRRAVVVLSAGVFVTGSVGVLLWVLNSEKLLGVLGVMLTALSVVVPAFLSRQDQPARGGPDPDDLAEQLAWAVHQQCERDAEVNRLNELKPLPLGWKPAATDLVDDRAAELGVAGASDQLVEYYRWLPGGRWVVLGEAGSGKSTLQLELTRGLLDDRATADRVPVQFPLASWDPSEHLYIWLARYLAETYPTLGVADPKRQQALEQLVERRVLPILDGLDEMAEDHQAKAIVMLSGLNREFGYVITCRAEEYRRAVRAAKGPLTGAAVVELKPISLPEATEYLRRVRGSDRDGWTELTAGRTADDPLAKALSTPLMVWLAGASYADRPGELAGWTDQDAIEDHLWDALVPAAYDGDPRWRPEDAQRWLIYLARYVRHNWENTNGDAETSDQDDIAWWRLSDAAEPLVRWVAGVTAALTTGGAFGLGIGYLFGVRAGVISGLLLGLLMGAVSAWSRLPPTTVEIRVRPRVSAGLAAGLFIGVIAGAAVWVVNRDLSAIWGMAGFGLPLGGVYGLTNTVDVAHATSPADVLHRERIFVLAYVLAYGLACGIALVLVGDPLFGLVLGVMAGLAGGLFNGLPWLVVHGLFKRSQIKVNVGAVAWFRYFLAKLTWLGPRPRLPWQLMTFLDDARAHGILRQVGAGHQFRHRRLWQRLAGESEQPRTPAST